MKIVCESCGAKYSIADEKVAGKVFKIRCKRCSEVIVVRGDEPAAEQVAIAGPPADAIWHVVVNGEQAGPYAVMQLSEMLSNGTIDWEAYVWTEGFDNWMPMRDVEDLVAQISGQGAQQGAGAMAVGGQAYGAAGAATLNAQPSMGADPFADDSGPSDSAMFGGGAAATAGPDLFGEQAAPSPFDGASPGVVASPSPRVSSEQAMTGARNENSVLFSLKNLQALATGSSSPSVPVPATGGGASLGGAGIAGGEGSGLIDIRALATTTGVGDKTGDDRDELLSMGSQNAFGAMASPMLAAPAEESGDNKRALYVALAAAAAFLGLAAVAVALILRPQATPQAQPAVAPAAPPATALATAVVPEARAEAEAPGPKGEPPSEGELAAKAAAEKQEHEGDEKHSSSSRRKAHRKSSSRSEDRASSKPEPAAPAAKAPEPAKPSGPRTLDDLLNGALEGKSKPARRAAPAEDSNLPDKPSRSDVVKAMDSVKGAVSACAQGQNGVAFVNITVAGKTGRVTNAQVTGVTGPAGSCIARAVRKARVSPFKSPQFKIKYPFRL